MYVFFGIKAWTQIWDTFFMGSNLSLWLSQVSSWACLWNALSLSSQTPQNISKIWDKVSTFESDSRLKSVHETGPRSSFLWFLVCWYEVKCFLKESSMFTAILSPMPFKMAWPDVLKGRPCHLHSLGLNKGSKWLSHLKQRTPASSHFNFFSSNNYLFNNWLLFVFCGIYVYYFMKII